MTGYTNQAWEKRLGFREFALLCARAMGFCVSLREYPMDAPLPEAFTVHPSYTEGVTKAESALAAWESLSPAEREASLRADLKEQEQSCYRAMEQARRLGAYFTQLKAETEAWKAPEDLARMREFMLEQIDSTLRYDGSTEYYEERIKEMESADLAECVQLRTEFLKRNLDSAREQLRKQTENVAEQNRHLNLLRESLKAA